MKSIVFRLNTWLACELLLWKQLMNSSSISRNSPQAFWLELNATESHESWITKSFQITYMLGSLKLALLPGYRTEVALRVGKRSFVPWVRESTFRENPAPTQKLAGEYVTSAQGAFRAIDSSKFWICRSYISRKSGNWTVDWRLALRWAGVDFVGLRLRTTEILPNSWFAYFSPKCNTRCADCERSCGHSQTVDNKIQSKGRQSCEKLSEIEFKCVKWFSVSCFGVLQAAQFSIQVSDVTVDCSQVYTTEGGSGSLHACGGRLARGDPAEPSSRHSSMTQLSCSCLFRSRSR